MAKGDKTKRKSFSSFLDHTNTNANETTTTTTTPNKRQKTDTFVDSNAASASASVSIAVVKESSTIAENNLVINRAAVEVPAEITIEQTLLTEEQLAVSTYQISMVLALCLCCYSIFHRIHCVFFKIRNLRQLICSFFHFLLLS